MLWEEGEYIIYFFVVLRPFWLISFFFDKSCSESSRSSLSSS